VIGKCNREELLNLLDRIMRPKAYGLTENQVDKVLLTFCAGCPDPVGARWLIVECLDPMTDEELVGRAMSMPARKVIDVPTSELPAGHPLRGMAL
jgi:hypothetical protein